MNARIIISLALALSGVLLGCSSAARRSAGTAPPDFSKVTITGFPYQTKPTWLGSQGMFFWYITQDKKKVLYEPCVGGYDIDLLAEGQNELIFKITGGHGKFLNLLSGQEIPKADAIGKNYRAKIKGNQIIAVAEFK